MSEKPSIPKGFRIAIVNPYLLRGHTESSEVEATARFIIAAKNLGIEAAAFSTSDEVHDFNPDFVIPISQQEPKLTRYPTYGLCLNPIRFVTASQRFMRNVFTYDGYFALTPNIVNWLLETCKATNKTLHIINAAFTVPRTEFKPLDLSNATAAYLGVNWDGQRHFELFEHFHDGSFLKCYGPKGSWDKYPPSLYGGMIPFDGVSALDTYARHGIGLCINHQFMEEEGIPTCRTYEIPASSAVTISFNNSFHRHHYGDSILYVDKNMPTSDLANAIKEKIIWVRNNPVQAQEMARSAHEIFNRQLSLEFFIENMVRLHMQVVKENGFTHVEKQVSQSVRMPKITYISKITDTKELMQLVNDIKNQTYANVNLVLLIDKHDVALMNEVQPYLDARVSMYHYANVDNNDGLLKSLHDAGTEWLGIVKCGDRLFKNHCSMLMKSYRNSQHDKSNEALALAFGNSLDHAHSDSLKDKIQDAHMLYLTSKVRIGNITPCDEIPLCAVLFKLSEALLAAFRQLDLMTRVRMEFETSTDPLEVAIHSNEITCSSLAADDGNRDILLIHNAVSPLYFKSNLHHAQGMLLVDKAQRQAPNHA